MSYHIMYHVMSYNIVSYHIICHISHLTYHISCFINHMHVISYYMHTRLIVATEVFGWFLDNSYPICAEYCGKLAAKFAKPTATTRKNI